MKRMMFAFGAMLALATAACARTDDRERDAREQTCIDNGWTRVVDRVADAERRLLWKAPRDRWRHGAIIVLHGGGGFADHWCHGSLANKQVEFANAAIAQGFAVFTLDSTDVVTDREGRACGKVWDDEVRDRPNIDLPFVGKLLRETIPALRPKGSGDGLFLTGLSAGGYMTVRAATHFDGLVTAFAPASSGDPYGWHRICDKSLSLRPTVFGIGVDNETNKRMTEEDSCRASAYPNEMKWDSQGPERKPAFKLFHHEKDGVHDYSCNEKVRAQLNAHGYADAGSFVLRDPGRRGFAHHLWQSAYTQPMLEFFMSRAR